MADPFFGKVQELIEQNMAFAMAIVVRAEKPTSGKPGDKAVITADGSIYGWIGGSCAQPTVIREAQTALKEGRSRFIRLSPDPASLTPRDGLIDFPLTCFSGGTLEIYIEPQYPQPRLLVVGDLPVARALVSLGSVMKYDVVVVDPDRKGEPDSDGVPVVTALADIGRYVLPDSYVVVASHGNYDEAALEQVMKARPRYIGLVASRKRFEAVLDYLRSQGIDETELARVKAPAGLDIQALRGDEIAVSILAEIIQVRRNSSPAEDAAEAPAPVEHQREHQHAAHEHVGHEHAAHEHGEHAAAASGMAIDPVCLMDVDIATAKYTYDYEGKTYYFCAPGCKLAFRRNPEEYVHPKVAIDPVCGMEVETAAAQHTSVYRDKTFYFCGEGCKAEFDRHPEAYVTVMHH